MTRPNCKRCGGPLDLWYEHESGWHWYCNNLQNKNTPIYTDEQFAELWDSLPGDDVVFLEEDLQAHAQNS